MMPHSLASFDKEKENDFVFFKKPTLRSLTTKISIFVDTTLKTVPRPYTGCLNIMAYDPEREDVIPLFHALLRRHENIEDLNDAFLSFLLGLGTKTKIETVMADFSKTQIEAIKIAFPASKIHGCRYHFMNAIQRKWVKTNKIMPENYVEEFRLLPGLGEENEIKARLGEIKKQYPEDSRLQDFINRYFIPTWIKSIPPSLWAHNGPFKTNNSVETFHSSLLKELSKRAYTVQIFKEALKTLGKEWVQDISNEAFFKRKKRNRRKKPSKEH